MHLIQDKKSHKTKRNLTQRVKLFERKFSNLSKNYPVKVNQKLKEKNFDEREVEG